MKRRKSGFPHLRIARPVGDIERSARMYVRGLELREIGRFENQAGFDGIMLGHPHLPLHFEFTHCHDRRIVPTPTREDLLVVYLPDGAEWNEACLRMLEAGFVATTAFNPYWNRRGRTFVDCDGYQVVLEQDTWPHAAR
jgi:catechol 2,3-dioxygenase-like lactoylglutathione lyase family enzyme